MGARTPTCQPLKSTLVRGLNMRTADLNLLYRGLNVRTAELSPCTVGSWCRPLNVALVPWAEHGSMLSSALHSKPVQCEELGSHVVGSGHDPTTRPLHALQERHGHIEQIAEAWGDVLHQTAGALAQARYSCGWDEKEQFLSTGTPREYVFDVTTVGQRKYVFDVTSVGERLSTRACNSTNVEIKFYLDC